MLTPLGEQQCTILASTFSSHSRVSLVIASPLTRTLQTALLSFGPTLSNGFCVPTVLALPEAQETSASLCNVGSDVDDLRKICQQLDWPVNLSRVHNGWNVKSSPKWAPTRDAISQRAKEARAFIWEKIQDLQRNGQESPEIVFVTHGAFLHYFTEDWEDSGIEKGKSLPQRPIHPVLILD